MQVVPDELRSWLAQMPKAELHLHLDGSLRAETAMDLAETRQLDRDDLPADLAAMRDRLIAPVHCRDQTELLDAFELPVALLQDAEALDRAADELVSDIAADGTVYAEIRWAPSLHTQRGLSLHDGIAAVTNGAGRAASREGVVVRLIAVALRTQAVELADEVATASLAFLDDGLTGFDIAGIEHEAPDPRIFASALDIARAGGLGITCHAGEWGGAAQVRDALAVRPWRIAHGAPAAEDPGLMAELRARGVTLDMCPTSNLQIGVGSGDPDDPLPRLLHAGVPVTISTDDRTVSDTTLNRELELAVGRLGLTPEEVAACMRHAYRVAFLHDDEGLRAELSERLDRWLAVNPAPAAQAGYA